MVVPVAGGSFFFFSGPFWLESFFTMAPVAGWVIFTVARLGCGTIFTVAPCG